MIISIDLSEDDWRLIENILSESMQDDSKSYRENIANGWVEDAADDKKYADAANEFLKQIEKR